jgi:hypothetical protein
MKARNELLLNRNKTPLSGITSVIYAHSPTMSAAATAPIIAPNDPIFITPALPSYDSDPPSPPTGMVTA